ncbi:MAG: hypothetical protein Q7R83_04175 [bacterium]|nr:hypothetical protein [bacterium]
MATYKARIKEYQVTQRIKDGVVIDTDRDGSYWGSIHIDANNVAEAWNRAEEWVATKNKEEESFSKEEPDETDATVTVRTHTEYGFELSVPITARHLR